MPFVDNSTYSEELLKKRKKYRKTTAIWGSVIFFLTLAIPFAYVFYLDVIMAMAEINLLNLCRVGIG